MQTIAFISYLAFAEQESVTRGQPCLRVVLELRLGAGVAVREGGSWLPKTKG